MRNEDSVSVRNVDYARAVNDLKLHTDTRWSPWRIIDGEDEEEAAVAA